MKCFRCGVCCSKYQAKLSLTEAKRIAQSMALPLSAFKEKYGDPRWQATRSILLRHVDGACIFLQQSGTKDNYCLIHDIKPLSCRKFKADLSLSECREGLLKCWQLSVGPGGQPEGTAEQLIKFNVYLESLE